MAHPLLLLAAGLGAGALGASAYAKAREKKLADDAARQAVLKQTTTTLRQGGEYAVQFAVDPRSPAWLADGGAILGHAPTSLDDASTTIRTAMERLGWKTLGPPQVRNPDNAKNFLAGQPAEWIMSAVWTLDTPNVASAPAWLGESLVFELPTNPAPVPERPAARQPAGYTVTFVPVQGQPLKVGGSAMATAIPVPGVAPTNDPFMLPALILWLSPDVTYGVLNAPGATIPDLQGEIIARVGGR